jgi:hypothetical protein
VVIDLWNEQNNVMTEIQPPEMDVMLPAKLIFVETEQLMMFDEHELYS